MRWFITGTDTDAGKTVVTACLAAAARTRGTVVAAKPVATGVEPGTAGEDATRIALAAGHPPPPAITFTAPVSPHRAALDAASPIDTVALRAWIEALEANTVLVEGVGGWRVPIQVGPSPIEVCDLARWTDGSVILVARDRLGVLNHTLLTVEAIQRDGLALAAVVLNRGLGDQAPPSNLADLRMLVDAPVTVLDAIDPHDPQRLADAGALLWRAVREPVLQRGTVGAATENER